MRSKLPEVGTTIFTVMSALASEHNAINLSQGFPDFDCDPHLQDLVYSYMRKGLNQYPPMRGVTTLLEEIAKKYEGQHGKSIDPYDEITVTSGASEALYSAISAIVHPGDEVIVIDPAYDLYRPAIRLNGGIPVTYSLKAPDFKIDWNELKKKFNDKTKAIIINTPHNPIGKTFSARDLSLFEDLVQQRNDLYIISDEVYEHIVFDGKRHESILGYEGLRQRGLAVFSFGKTYHVTGWRVGYCIAPAHIMSEFRKVHQFNSFTVQTPMQYALAEYMKEPQHYLQLSTFFEKKRNILQDLLHGSKFKAHSSEGSYFQLYDYSEVSNTPDQIFAKELTKDHGVAVIPMSVFYEDPDPTERLVRLCFGKRDETLVKAAARLSAI